MMENNNNKDTDKDQVKINLTMKQIFDVLCPDCQGKLLDLGCSDDRAREFAKRQMRAMLERQMKA